MAYERKDAFYRRAKSVGYRSRAAYKLAEMVQRERLIRRGDRVVDLGAWPGGWMQVAAEAVGPEGRVVGVDLVEITPLAQVWARTVFGDVADENVQGRALELLGGQADVLLSDMAPKLSGVRARDEARAAELVHLALGAAVRLLRPGGRMLLKVFTGSDSGDLLRGIAARFDKVRMTRPEATRKGSSELYAVTAGYRPAPP